MSSTQEKRQIMEEAPPKAVPPSDLTAQMSFLEHLEELRWHIIKGLLGMVVGIIVAIVFVDFILTEVLLGPSRADFFMYTWIGVDAVDIVFQSRRLTGQFFAYWGSIVFAGAIMGSPVFFFQLWKFILPALESKEKRSALLNTTFITFFFLLGIAFGYLILVPFALQFFAQFQPVGEELIRNDFDISEYFNAITLWVLACGLLFQIPVVSYFLSKIGFLTPQFLRKYQKHAVIASLFLAAVLTPPDYISQLIMSVPIFVLYELSIWISKFANWQRKKKLKETFGEDFNAP